MGGRKSLKSLYNKREETNEDYMFTVSHRQVVLHVAV